MKDQTAAVGFAVGRRSRGEFCCHDDGAYQDVRERAYLRRCEQQHLLEWCSDAPQHARRREAADVVLELQLLTARSSALHQSKC